MRKFYLLYKHGIPQPLVGESRTTRKSQPVAGYYKREENNIITFCQPSSDQARVYGRYIFFYTHLLLVKLFLAKIDTPADIYKPPRH